MCLISLQRAIRAVLLYNSGSAPYGELYLRRCSVVSKVSRAELGRVIVVFLDGKSGSQRKDELGLVFSCGERSRGREIVLKVTVHHLFLTGR